jgi:hypothetical protein
MRPLFYILFVSGLAGQPPLDRQKTSAPAERLDIMRQSLASTRVHDISAPADLYHLRAEPVLRFTNTVGDTRDGAIFIMLDDGERPGAAVQVFLKRDGTWIQEWTSLSTKRLFGNLVADPEWRPTSAGVEFRPVPDAPQPAEQADQRLRQMHAMTREFSAEDQFRFGSWQPLRLLSKPLARYGKPDSAVFDGALFAYMLTTDPEVFLLIEARAGTDGPKWQYAFAPMSVYGLRGLCKGKEVWSVDFRPSGEPAGTFYLRWFTLPESSRPLGPK